MKWFKYFKVVITVKTSEVTRIAKVKGELEE